ERLRNDVAAMRRDHEQAVEAANGQCEQAVREALRNEREAFEAVLSHARQESDRARREQLASAQNEFILEREALKGEVSKHQAEAESLGQERDDLRRRIASMQQEMRERAENFESSQKAHLAKLETSQQQLTDLEKRFRAEQSAVIDLRREIDA